MNPDDARRAMTAMYGGGETDHDAAFMRRDAEGGGPGIRDMPEFRHGPKGPLVDRIEGDTATLLMPDGSTQDVPVRVLPHGTREGAYLGPNGLDDLISTGKDNSEIRGRLSAGDDGSDVKL